MDEVFKAINDPSRRLLLDALYERDGRTLGELCELLPSMTRYGVMSHLRVLEEAGLVTTARSGRSKHHYLNPVPIRQIHDRWISRFAERTVGAMTALKQRVEGGSHVTMPDHVYNIHIKGTAADVWAAIVDPDKTAQYFYGTRAMSSWEPGSRIEYLYPDGTVAADGEILEIVPEKRVEMTFHAKWDPELEAEGPVRQAWIVEETDGSTVLTVETFDMDRSSKTYGEFTGGLPFILSGLKTLVETGKPMAG